ncbi:acyltransferase [Allomuricauda sp. CP2A]|jgi:acetyltransferase-like isoleucine patch superfamily enzyme|uniref:acyltransferase n=1 Tax=Allomuricauda sp. CP2A TaxID=1848189 RepID=UPI00082A7E53|nr:acyltransferase [Muricauda sp. CP2A]
MNLLRKSLKRLFSVFFTFFAKISCRNFKAGIKVNGPTILTKNVVFGKNIHFNGLRVYGKGKVFFGSNFHSGKNCKIITDVHNYEGNKLPYDETYIVKDVFIGDNVWLGMDVTILGGVTIGDGAIIQAGSVVVGDIERLSIAGGHPARVFSHRNESHYKSLVASESFF